uniref:Ig-like domain-containing protein n=1 Tax=Otus sunia TaxID=257818 RepID=A0A8C8AI23_9STRI
APGTAADTGLTPAPSLGPAVPVAGATIAMARTESSVPAGESLNLSCSVQAGTAPVTFTWLRDGQELGSGPVLALGAVGPAHAGTYHCLATNRGSRAQVGPRSPAPSLGSPQGSPGPGADPGSSRSVPSCGRGAQRVPPAPARGRRG